MYAHSMIKPEPSLPAAGVSEDERLSTAPPSDEEREEQRLALERTILRSSGLLLLSSTLLIALSQIVAGSTASSTWISVLIDLAVGVSLLSGDGRAKSLAIFRASVGLVFVAALFFGALSVGKREVAAGLLVHALVSLSLLVLLWGQAGRFRARLGLSVGISAMVLHVALGVFLGLRAVEPDGPPVLVRGVSTSYSLMAPPSFVAMDREQMLAQNAAADTWLVDAMNDSHVIVACRVAPDAALPNAAERPNDAPDADATAKTVGAEAEPAAAALFFEELLASDLEAGWKLESRTAPAPREDAGPLTPDGNVLLLTGASDGAGGRAQLVRPTPQGIPVTLLLETRASPTSMCGIYAFAQTTMFVAERPRFDAMLASFKLD